MTDQSVILGGAAVRCKRCARPTLWAALRSAGEGRRGACRPPREKIEGLYLVKYQNSGVSQNWVWLAREACVPDSVFFHTTT